MSDTPQPAPQPTAAATPARRKPRGRPFTGADDPRNRQNIEAAGPAEVPEPADEVNDGAPPLLKDLRWAYRNLAAGGRGTGQQEYWRRVLKKTPLKFAEMFMKLDREFRQSGGTGKAASPQAPNGKRDDGTERATVLIDGLLDGIHEKLAKEDAELAARPDGARHGATLQAALKGAVERYEMFQRQCVWLRAKVRALGGDPWRREPGDPDDPPPGPDRP